MPLDSVENESVGVAREEEELSGREVERGFEDGNIARAWRVDAMIGADVTVDSASEDVDSVDFATRFQAKVEVHLPWNQERGPTVGFESYNRGWELADCKTLTARRNPIERGN